MNPAPITYSASSCAASRLLKDRFPSSGTFRNETEMHLVDGYRGIGGVLLLAAPHPRPIAPGVCKIPDDRRRLWRDLPVMCEGISFLHGIIVVPTLDVILIESPMADLGYKPLPDTGVVVPYPERVYSGLPSIENLR